MPDPKTGSCPFSDEPRVAPARRPAGAAGRLLGLILLFQVAPLLAQAAPEADARSLLARMATAVRTLDYQGAFVYEHDGRIDALRIFHAGGERERERLVRISGARGEVVRDGASVACLRSGAPTVLFQSRGARLLPLVPNTNARNFAQHYTVRSAGEDRVAGFGAHVVEITPRDAWRYGYRLWIDDAAHLLLRSAVIDASRRTLEQFMFVSLEVGAKPRPSDLALSAEAGLSAPPAEVPLDAAPRWRVADAPPGFVLLRAQRPAEGATEAEHQMYTDGVATVSVYIEPRAEAAPAAAGQAATRGLISAYSHHADRWKITALGDVPRATLERMARSVQPETERR